MLVDRTVALDVRHDDAQQVIHLAAHAVDLDDLGDLIERVQKALVPGFAVIRRLHRHEHGRADIQLLRIEQGDRPADHTGFLQAANAPPARRLGQADALGDLGDTQGRIALQQVQDSAVYAIHETLLLI